MEKVFHMTDRENRLFCGIDPTNKFCRMETTKHLHQEMLSILDDPSRIPPCPECLTQFIIKRQEDLDEEEKQLFELMEWATGVE